MWKRKSKGDNNRHYHSDPTMEKWSIDRYRKRVEMNIRRNVKKRIEKKDLELSKLSRKDFTD